MTFRFGGSDDVTSGPNLTYECALDPVGAPAWEPCESPLTIPGDTMPDLAAGSHTFLVRAIDATDKPDMTPAEHSWTQADPQVDTEAPDTVIDSRPDPVTVLTSGMFEFSSPDPTVTLFECVVDAVDPIPDAAWAECTSPETLHALDVGEHSFHVRAVDPAGNADPTPAVFTWTVTDPPVASPVYCGQLVVQSVELVADLIDCPEVGIVIGADDITIDLGGYTIDGVGLGIGVRNRGFDNVTVTNGVVTGFDVGVLLDVGTSGNIVQSLQVHDNQGAGIALIDADSGSTGNTIRHNTIAGNDLGITITKGTRGTLVQDNVIGANSGDGVRIDHSSESTVEGNQITGSSDGGVTLVGAAENRVLDNTLSDNGIVVESGYPIQVIPVIPIRDRRSSPSRRIPRARRQTTSSRATSSRAPGSRSSSPTATSSSATPCRRRPAASTCTTRTTA